MPIHLNLLLFAAAAFLVGELVAVPVFRRIRQIYAPKLEGRPSDQRVALMKGMLERLVLYLGLILGYAVVLAAFGAFKLGTRLQKDSADTVSNDYFLVGNLLSVLIVMGDIILGRLLLGVRPF
ncbi:hypothetical protein [Synoicihabitans lomoniglobus]|uniref:Uncharacterized protein n=1 Tax=Synoicihabitans lomoniglobus TaxID=2909285 RepID=A0AAF0I4G1_9BACT|nr:hypothetical protein [Opitutaceae bacterium LMO-M01]WED66764.1 hypothetical protein PXH66_07865 [Opitutaceae bacterium LMO-M01]